MNNKSRMARRPAPPSASRRPRPAAARAAQQRAQDTREKIVAAALDAFAEHGFDGATTRDIAAAAGVNQGLITYHFSSKQELWKAAVEQVFGPLRARFASRLQALEGVDTLTRLRLLMRDFVRFAAAHPQLHRLMVQEGRRDGARMQWLVDHHVRPLYELTRDLIEAAQREALLPQTPPLHLYYALVGAASLPFVMAPECKRLTGIDPLQQAVIDTHADTIAALLLGLARMPRAARPSAPRRTGPRRAVRAG